MWHIQTFGIKINPVTVTWEDTLSTEEKVTGLRDFYNRNSKKHDAL